MSSVSKPFRHEAAPAKSYFCTSDNLSLIDLAFSIQIRCFLPFSSLIASMLLFKNRIISVEIINLTSLLAQYNLFIDDEIDNMDIFSTCVICNNYSYFETIFLKLY